MTRRSLVIAQCSWRFILVAMLALVLVGSALVPLTDTALAQSNPSRSFLPSIQVYPGQTIDVWVSFAAPADAFNSIGIADTVPAGWTIAVNAAWCSPVADAATITGDDAEYAWFGPYSSGELFAAMYQVTVPGGASLGLYPFLGQLGYKIASSETIFEVIGGEFEVEVVEPDISVTKTANPTSLAEPGGPVNFTVNIGNPSPSSVTIDSLVDDVHGNLDGQGTCSVPQTIAAGGSYTCDFTATVSGNAGDSEMDVVTASGTEVTGAPVSDDDDATVDITDVQPVISVMKSASPTAVLEPGGDVTFTVVINNNSVPSDPVTINSLVDDVHGNLDGQGDCSVPQTIPAGGSYTCSFTATVSGNAGYIETDVATANGQDDEGNPVSNSDDATVTIVTDAPPPASVPTTSQWGLIGMATVFAALLVLFVRRRLVANASNS